MGVRRALDMAWQISGETESSKKKTGVYTLGPLIHNPRVLDDLGKRGIKTLKEGEMPPENSTLIIRAHGIPPSLEDALRSENVDVLDATCPNVKANQKTAREFSQKGYWVFLAGEKNHGEIIGIQAYADASRCSVAADPAEAEAAAAELFSQSSGGSEECKDMAGTVLIGQTTISPGEFKAIGEAIKKYFPDLKIINTICGATAERQRALGELCARVDAVIVIGGRESANTRRLLSLALELGKPAWIAESAGDLPPEISSYERVGLSAGASTPEDLIAEVEQALMAGESGFQQ